MSMNSRSRSLVCGIATVVAVTLLAPVAVTAEEEVVALAPVTAPAVTSTSGDDVRAARALAAERALQSGDIGSMQEDRLLAIVAAAPSWDESSGYGSVEASRAAASALLAPVAGSSWDETSGYGSVERSRAEMTASLSGELISGQEQAAALAAAMSWDEMSGYGAVEASRAANALPEEPVVLDRGTRAESAILWTILHPAEDTVPVALSDC